MKDNPCADVSIVTDEFREEYRNMMKRINRVREDLPVIREWLWKNSRNLNTYWGTTPLKAMYTSYGLGDLYYPELEDTHEE